MKVFKTGYPPPSWAFSQNLRRVAIDADTKLVPSWRIGDRDSEVAMAFVDDLASRLANRVQITTDGHRPYLEAIEGAFGGDVDYAMLKRFPSDLNRGDSQRVMNGRVFVH